MTVDYQIPTDLTEKQIEADVSNYFGYMSPIFGNRLRLLDINEQLTGADKRHWTGAVAYYFQFKKPIGLKSTADLKPPSKKRKNEAKMMEIRRFRESNGLDQYPYSICFQLHGDADTPANKLQHNVLFQYEAPPNLRAMYICPATLNGNEYEKMLSHPFWRGLWRSPFSISRRQTVYGLRECSEISFAPFLRAHVTVIPHTTVSTFDHYYSFSKTGTDIAFHSPEYVAGGPSRLSDFLAADLLRLIRNPESLPPVGELAGALHQRSSQWAGDAIVPPNNEDPIEWLQMHGRMLLKKHSIRQVIVLANIESLATADEVY